MIFNQLWYRYTLYISIYKCFDFIKNFLTSSIPIYEIHISIYRYDRLKNIAVVPATYGYAPGVYGYAPGVYRYAPEVYGYTNSVLQQYTDMRG